MDSRSFYLYRRTPSAPFYVKYRNPLSGEIGPGRSTRTKNREEAEYLKDGPRLIDWLLLMWDYDKSPYVREKKAHRQRISRLRCYDMVTNINHHWKEYFQRSPISVHDAPW